MSEEWVEVDIFVPDRLRLLRTWTPDAYNTLQAHYDLVWAFGCGNCGRVSCPNGSVVLVDRWTAN